MYRHQPLNQFGKIGQKRLQKQPITHCVLASNQFGQKVFQNIYVATEPKLLSKQIFASRKWLMVKFLMFHHHYGHFPCVTAVRHGVLKGFWNHKTTSWVVTDPDSSWPRTYGGLPGIGGRWGNRNIMATNKKDVTGFNPSHFPKQTTVRDIVLSKECRRIVLDGHRRPSQVL